MSESGVTSPEVPADLAQMSSVSEYRAVREGLLRETAERPTVQELAGEAPAPAPEATETSETGEASEPEPQADARERDDHGRFKKKNPQQRIDRVVYEREQARQEAAQLRAQLAAMQSRQSQPEAPQGVPQAPQSGYAQPDRNDPEPSPEAYSDYATFLGDQARWAARQEFRSLQAREQAEWAQAQAQRAMQERASSFADRLDKATADDPELLADIIPEVLNLRPAMSLRPGEQTTGATAIADALLESEAPHRLMRYLSDYPEDLRRISALHPMLAMREIGRLETRLDTAPTGTVSAPPISQAKPPIQPVGRSAAVPSGPRDASQINSVAEWRAYRDRMAGAR